MFMFSGEVWNIFRERFAESYRRTAPVARATGYREMLDHRWLTDDHRIQRTTFAGGITVTANFGDKPYVMEDGRTLGPLSSDVAGIEPEASSSK